MGSPTPLTFNDWVAAVAALAVEATTTVAGVAQFVSPTMQTLIPTMLDYAELRIARDLDLAQLVTASTYSTAAGNNVLGIPIADFVAVETLSINGVPLTAVSKEWLQAVYGTSSGAAQPTYFAPYGGNAGGGNTTTNFLLGPWPDRAYTVAAVGYARAPSLYANATAPLAGSATTLISAWLPDLLIQASMIVVAEAQRNFGATSNDPQQGFAYEQVYLELLRGAQVEEARKRFAASAWSSVAPPVAATPGR